MGCVNGWRTLVSLGWGCVGLFCLFAVQGRNLAWPADPQPQDWASWRGPERNGTASPDQDPPLDWSPTENIVWKRSIPGRGHGSPIVVGDQIFLPTAGDQLGQQVVLCIDRLSGDLLWETTVHESGEKQENEKASQASSTIASDGERVFVNFLSQGAVYTTALNRDGEQVWQAKVTDYVVHQGYGSSPAIYHDLVIVSADNKGGGAIVAFDRVTGEQRWRHSRPAKPNYSSPIVLNVAGRDQLLMTGCDLITSLDPLTGEPLWEIQGATTECVTSTVTNGELVFSSGGYPRNHLTAVRGDGSGEVVWEVGDRLYVPSLLIKGDYLYSVHDNGVAACWLASTGEQIWKARLGGNFTASPVLVGDRIYAIDEAATTTIFRASPAGFEQLGRNELADDAFATPTIVGGRIYARVGSSSGDTREEVLYCLGD